MQQSYKLIVEDSLERQIRYMCHRLPNNEWSGILFYTVEGDFKDKNLVFHATDMYLLDIGTSGFTQFNRDSGMCTFMIEHDLLDACQGLIHSHNNMATFFSGEDQHTLQDEGNDQNHFLSLIVNNAGTYSAKVTRKIKSTVNYTLKGHRTISYNTYGNVLVTPVDEDIDKTESKDECYIESYKLEITKAYAPDLINNLGTKLNTLKEASTSYVNSSKNPVIPRTTKPGIEGILFPQQARPVVLEKSKDPVVSNTHKPESAHKSYTVINDELDDEDAVREQQILESTEFTEEFIQDSVAKLVKANPFATAMSEDELVAYITNSMKHDMVTAFNFTADDDIYTTYISQLVDTLASNALIEFDPEGTLSCVDEIRSKWACEVSARLHGLEIDNTVLETLMNEVDSWM